MDDNVFFFDLEWVLRLASHAAVTPSSGPCNEHPDGECPGSLLWVSDDTGVYLESNGLPAAEFGPGTSSLIYARGWEPGGEHQDPDSPFDGGFVSPLHLRSATEPATALLKRMRASGFRFMYLRLPDDDVIEVGFAESAELHPQRPVTAEEVARRRQTLIENMRATADGGKFTIMNIHADSELPTSMLYTVGLTAAGQPELLTVGLAVDVAHHILNDLGESIRAGERRLHHAQVLTDVLDGFDVCVIEADMHLPGRLVPGMAYEVFGRRNVRLQQIVWPDALHQFPWDSGFDSGLVQPVIGRPAMR
ncbi:hypothetical protein GCM10009679_20610 [Saccharothrix algeriensis]|uniref:DUF4262 domain-containing protein n=3 Tax=Catellatospora bangladeshensis TaxID=310355 RepID=A0A8J3JBZ8_9ACTN|nr:hypothetical protein Cba03nite_34160 [Catellatospora bangladeshensis]